MTTTVDGTTGLVIPGTGSLILTGATSGTVTMVPPAVAGSTTLTTPSTTGTLALTSNAVRQIVRSTYTSTASGSTVIPMDNTIPQNTEGDQFMTATITPVSATSTLRIDVLFNGSNSFAGTQSWTLALFQDSTANALAANYVTSPGQYFGAQVPLTYFMTSGTTSATTFKVRAGTQSSGSVQMNTASGGLYGGTWTSFISITEYFT